jgi:glutaminyl-tRNA synthetase
VARFAYFGPSLEFINRLLPEKARAPTADTVQVVFNSPKGDPHMADTDVATRFPPEPNGYLHIGHAKSICLNFGLAGTYGGTCNLRFDDTNPTKEERRVRRGDQGRRPLAGIRLGRPAVFASDYFEQLYDFAVELINRPARPTSASLSADEIREYRGTLTEPGRTAPTATGRWKRTSTCFSACAPASSPTAPDPAGQDRHGVTPTSTCATRSSTASAHGCIHHRTGGDWCIYPMYDFTHCLSDAMEGITHSMCTLEFENHRPLYDWVLDNLEPSAAPQQIEFARLNLTYTVMSKRKLLNAGGKRGVSGWDDPRMPTNQSGCGAGLYRPRRSAPSATASAWPRRKAPVDIALLEFCVREDLNASRRRGSWRCCGR